MEKANFNLDRSSNGAWVLIALAEVKELALYSDLACKGRVFAGADTLPRFAAGESASHWRS
jgi:hypothetical protein